MTRPRSNPPRWARQDRLPTLDQLAWLRSPEGQDVCAVMAAGDPADTPAAIERWRQRLDAELVATAWTQATLRRAARAKFSRSDRMLFDRVGLEQATDEVVAEHKARRFAGLGCVADLCCGLGGDAIALAGQSSVVAVDWSAPRLAMAEHNAAAYGRAIRSVTDDVCFHLPDADAAHIDPDRRPGGPRRHQPEAGSPDLDTLTRIVRRYEHLAIKLSPGADLDSLPFDAEIELISHRAECKQAVAWTGRFHQAHRRATVLPTGESISADRDDDLTWPAPRPPTPGGVLLEPDPAVIRANLVGVFARAHKLSSVAPDICYLVGDVPVATSLAYSFRVIDVMDFSLKPTRAWLAKHDVGQLEVKTRGFAATPETLLSRLRPNGSRTATLFVTRAADGPMAILAERQTQDEASALPDAPPGPLRHTR